MDFFDIRKSFGKATISLKNLLGLDVKQIHFEVVNQEIINDYDEFYKNKELPATESKGEIQIKALKETITYFDNHRQWMYYDKERVRINFHK